MSLYSQLLQGSNNIYKILLFCALTNLSHFDTTMTKIKINNKSISSILTAYIHGMSIIKKT